MSIERLKALRFVVVVFVGLVARIVLAACLESTF